MPQQRLGGEGQRWETEDDGGGMCAHQGGDSPQQSAPTCDQQTLEVLPSRRQQRLTVHLNRSADEIHIVCRIQNVGFTRDLV